MRHVVILSHPDPASLNAAIAKTYAGAAEALGEAVEIRDLYAEGFDPRLPVHELPWSPSFALAPGILAERDRLAAAQVLVFVYPLWINAPPAMMKGYVERVLGMGLGYGEDEGGIKASLTGKSLISITTSGAPGGWVGQTGAMDRLRAGFDDYIAAVCGLAVLDHLHIGGVTPDIRPDVAQGMLDSVTRMARRHFAPADPSQGDGT